MQIIPFVSQYLWNALKRTWAPRTRKDLENQQIKKFRQLVRYAIAHSSYYREHFEKNHLKLETCCPQDFPALTKQDVKKHFNEIVTDSRLTQDALYDFLARSKNPGDLFLNQYYVIHTSGSSGEPGFFVFSKKEWIRGMSHLLKASGGMRLGQKLAFVAAIEGHFAGISIAKTALQLPLLYHESRFYDIHGSMPKIIEDLNRFQPTILTGYPTALKHLALAQQKKELHIQPIFLKSGGEPVAPLDQDLIETAFQAPLMNIYASTEFLLMGAGLPGHKGMVLHEEDLIFEIHPDYTCVTSLFNKTFPLIRYRMNDVLIPKASSNHIPYQEIETLVGRNEITPIFINRYGQEDFIHPAMFSQLFSKHLERFQIEVRDKQNFVLKTQFRDSLNIDEKTEALQDICSKMRYILSEKAMENVRFEIKEVTSLWVDPNTGKFKLVVS